MAIQFLSGIPGAGKSLLAVKWLCDELIHGNRHVCTNLPLKLDELEKYLIAKTGSADGMRRLRMLTDSECMEFWLHYGVGYDVQGRISIKSGDRAITVPDLGARFRDGEKFPGTAFFIDEFHIFFPARAWMKTGDDALYYQSQHRGLGDDVVLLSQHPEQCDKAMRRLCQDFTYLTNLGKTKILGFSFPGLGRMATYAKETDKDPIATGTYRLPIKEYGDLYDTNAKTGGIVGRTETKEKGGGGRSPYWIPVAILGVLAACFFLPKLVFSGISAVVSSGLDGMTEVSTQAVKSLPMPQFTNSPLVTNYPVQPLPVVATPQKLPTVIVATNLAPLVIERRVILGDKRTYWLSDGRKITNEDPDCLVAKEDYIILHGGKVVRIK